MKGSICIFVMLLSLLVTIPAQGIEIVKRYKYEVTDKNKSLNQGDEKWAVDPVSGAIAGASFIYGLYNERKKAKKLSSMQSYLQTISSQLDKVQKQNIEILQRIDQLPLDMEVAIKKNRLDKAYRLVEAYKDVFYSWRRVKRWDMGSGAKLVYCYRDIAQLETDHEKVFDLIWTSDFLLIVSRYSMRPKIIKILSERKARIDALLGRKAQELNEILANIKADLISPYVQEYSLDTQNNVVKWTMTGHRTENYTIIVQESYAVERRYHGDDHQFIEYRNVEYTRTRPDAVYNGAHDQTDQRLVNNYAKLKDLAGQIDGIEYISNGILGTYIGCLEKDSWQPKAEDKVRFVKSDELLIKRAEE